METQASSGFCQNCGTTLQGKFCHVCGEKIVESSDFAIITMLKQAFDGITNIDSKVIKSFKYLVFRPGKLTDNYVKGVRVPFMKPIQLFLVINVLFFFVLPKADILRIPSGWYFEQPGRYEKLTDLSVTTGKSIKELMQLYDAASLDYSKALVIVVIPFTALLMALLNFRKRFEFGKHIIFAMHYFSFFMVFCICLLFVPFVDGNPLAIQTSIIGINFVYLFFAVKVFYQDNIKISILKALVAVIGCMVIAFMYRQFISDFSFKMIS